MPSPVLLPPDSPAPPVSTAPPPPPIPAAYDFPEYRQSAGLAAMDAATAYAAGADGHGVTVGIIDTGILTSSGEFRGRISPLSTDVTGGNRGIADQAGHGTAVASIVGAARNGTGIMGVAYQATLLALRSESRGSCPECTFTDPTVARAIDLAVADKARVINLSMGGSSSAPEVVAAVRRAAAAGVVVVIAAGNDYLPQPSVFARVASDPAAAGMVLVVGSLESDDRTLSAFSNRAGAWAPYYLAAPGHNVAILGLSGQPTTGSGTSFSAPQVTGAVALLAQAFPNLTGRDIVRILLSSAVALGDATIAGQGRLSLTAAMKPIGTLSLAGSGTPLGPADPAVLSAPFGDLSLAGLGLEGIVGLDSYRRAYRFNLAANLRAAPTEALLAPALALRQGVRSARLGAVAAHLLVNRPAGFAPAWDDGTGPQRAARASLAGSVLQMEPSRDLALRLALGGAGAGTLLGSGPGFAPRAVAAPDPLRQPLLSARPDLALATRLGRGPLQLALFAEQGRQPALVPGPQAIPARYSAWGVGLDRRRGALETGLALTQVDESGRLLGSQWPRAFGLRGARTVMLDARAGWQFDPHWRLAGALRLGRTRALTGAGLIGGASLASSASSVTLTGESLFFAGDALSLGWVRPWRVDSARFAFDLPVAYSYATLEAGRVQPLLDAGPRGREQVVEAAYRLALGAMDLDASLAWRHQPGNRAAASDQAIGAATLEVHW